jgi:hypothetical protein
MRQRKLIYIFALLTLAGCLWPLVLTAQDSTPSVAEAARRAREQKKKATKPAPVVTDDTLHPSSSAPASTPETNAPAHSNTPDSSAAPQEPKKDAATSADDDKKKKAEIESLKQRISEQKETVKLAQREIALQQDTFYSNPDYAHDKAGKDKLDALKADLQQKQDALADLRAKLGALGGTEDSTPAPTAQSKP